MYENSKELCFGFYYDDPSLIKDSSECRAVVGFLFKPLSKKDVDYAENYLRQYGFKYAEFKNTKCVYSWWQLGFPVTLSYILAPMKFYKKLGQFLNSNPKYKDLIKRNPDLNYCGVELYDKSRIYFHAPLENLSDFDLTCYSSPESKKKS